MRYIPFVVIVFLAFAGRWTAAEDFASDAKLELALVRGPQRERCIYRRRIVRHKGTPVADSEAPPVVKLMTEVEGVSIPRVTNEGATTDWKSPLPVDAGNPAARQNAAEEASGGRIVVRMMSEPRSMNPITETSAVQSLIAAPYVTQSLASQNPETLDFEPMLAKRWIVEDSIKLSPGILGKTRYLQLNGGGLVTSAAYEFPERVPGEPPPELQISTYGSDQKKLGKVWVGLYPAGAPIGAPRNGYHFWSDAEGNLTVPELVPGKYRVATGCEIRGVTEELRNGWLKVTPVSPHNPLREMLGRWNCLLLRKNAYVDLQRETVFTFEIDERARWSDGVPFTTRDLEFGYALITNPSVDGDLLRAYYADLVRCDPLDDLTIQMQYRHQYFKAFEFAAGLAYYSPPRHIFESYFRDAGETLTLERLSEDEERVQNKVSVHGVRFGRFFNTDGRYSRKPIGTGPYVIDRWIPSDRIVLIRNPNYWTDRQRGYLDEIVFKFISNEVAALQALQAGQIDFLYQLSAEKTFAALQPEPDWFRDEFVKASWYFPSFTYIGWNLNRPQFEDRRVRLAMSLLLDVDAFLDQYLYGQGVLVSGSPYYFSPSYDHEVKPIGYDPDAARQLLQAAGWSDTDGDGLLDKHGRPFEFTYLVSASGNAEILGATLQEECSKVGIRVNLDRLEWATFLEKAVSKDFDAMSLAWLTPIESDPYLIWHSSQAGPEARSSNHVSFRNPVADELIEEIRVTLDPDRRSQLFRNLHRVLDQQQPYTFLYTTKAFGAYHNRYRGVKWYRIHPCFDLTEWYVPKDLQRD